MEQNTAFAEGATTTAQVRGELSIDRGEGVGSWKYAGMDGLKS
jgi:hypothetical protein